MKFYLGKYECECPENWNGPRCTLYDTSFSGGIGVYLSPGTILRIDNEDDYDVCEIHECMKKSGNRKCNEECNIKDCNYDGGDCSLGKHLHEYILFIGNFFCLVSFSPDFLFQFFVFSFCLGIFQLGLYVSVCLPCFQSLHSFPLIIFLHMSISFILSTCPIPNAFS